MNYSSPIRAEHARLTQRRITEAAYELFLDQGYAPTTIAAVARRAGVSAQTVYNVFGSKAALLKRVYDVRLVGDEEPVPLARRPEVVALYQTDDAAGFLRGYAALGRRLSERLGPLLLVIAAGAAAGDADLIAHAETANQERLTGTGMVVRRVAELGALRADVSLEQARDRIWTLNSAEVWHLLTRVRGWSGEQYERWIGEAMCDAVLARPC